MKDYKAIIIIKLLLVMFANMILLRNFYFTILFVFDSNRLENNNNLVNYN